MFKVEISPGCMGGVKHAIDLFGSERVLPGDWTTPFWIIDLSDEEVDFAKEFFGEHGKNVKVIPINL